VDERAHAELKERLDDVRLLPLEELQIARPVALLKNHAGYVMRLLTDMEPIRALIAPAGTDELAAFYIRTGGLRRRLRVLARTAELLSRVHAIPAVYGDLSPNNAFISKDPAQSEVWLIDPDNLRLEGARGPTVYTPGFGAPEVMQGRSRATTLSDAWAFAVLAFQILCQAHPMLGELVEEGGWEESVDLEAKAFGGELPWMHDEDDDSNYGEFGIFPRELVLSPRLIELFQRALGPGRTDPTSRPSMQEWAEVLQQAADLTLSCPDCGSSSYVSARGCSWCDSPKVASFLYIQVKRWHPEVDEQLAPSGSPVAHLVLDGGANEATVPRRLLRSSLPRHTAEDYLRLNPTRRGIRLTPLAGGPYLLVDTESGRITDLSGPVELPLPVAGREWHLHCGPVDEYHRVASFRYFREGKR
jgi:DNA-binding helix-hairpin-helix protein with protein kinase domain